MSRRRICIVTGTRAEYGLLSGVIEAVEAADDLQLQLVVTGAHLSPHHGNTVAEIVADGHRIDATVPILTQGDTRLDMARAIAAAVSGGSEALATLQPDIVVLLGDRYEILGFATACLALGIPIAHLHGGETTEGAIDESVRHAVTKMSALHFVAAEPYRRRVLQLGENPQHVYLVGGLGVDAIRRTSLLTQAELETDLGFSLDQPPLLVTFHPETITEQPGDEQIRPLLETLRHLSDETILFTMPNADAEGAAIRTAIEQFVADHPNAHARDSLGYLRYLSLLPMAKAVVGNSSSGLAEAPTFQVPTINIGHRQDGRLRAASVIDCANDAASIRAALQRLDDRAFQETLAGSVNPYGDGGAAERIIAVLRTVPLDDLTRKPFWDVATASGSGDVPGSPRP